MADNLGSLDNEAARLEAALERVHRASRRPVTQRDVAPVVPSVDTGALAGRLDLLISDIKSILAAS